MSAVEAIRNQQARELQGSRAGIVSRFLADLADWLLVEAGYVALLVGFAIARYLLNGKSFALPRPPLWFTILVPIVMIVGYLTSSWASTGRTVGKGLMGLRVVTGSGAPLGPRRAFLRATLCTLVPAVVLWVIVSRTNKGVHDILLRTAVVYDWTTRETRLAGTS